MMALHAIEMPGGSIFNVNRVISLLIESLFATHTLARDDSQDESKE